MDPASRIAHRAADRPQEEASSRYLRILRPHAPQPPRSLKGYRKVSLRPGRAKTVRMTLTDRDLAYWNAEANGWRIAAGSYRLFAGFSSRAVRRVGTLTQAAEAPAR